MTRRLRHPGPAAAVTVGLLAPGVIALGALARLAIYYRPQLEPLILGGLVATGGLLGAAAWRLARRRRSRVMVGITGLLVISAGGGNGASYLLHRDLNLPRLPGEFEPAATAPPVVRPFPGIRPPRRMAAAGDPAALIRWKGVTAEDPADAFYRHSLLFIDSLLDDTSATRHASLAQAAEVVDSWIRENSAYTTYPPSPFTWGDHSTALRLTRLLALRERTDATPPAPLDRELLDRSIVGHARRLALREFYTATNNHGLDQDIALLQAAWVMRGLDESGAWADTALSRLRATVAFLVSSTGVMREHSPGYHLSTQRHLEATAGYLRASGRVEDAEWLGAVVDGMKRVTPWFVEPSGLLAPLGDTDGDVPVTMGDLGGLPRAGSTFSSSTGERLPHGVLALVDDGYVFLRQRAATATAESWHLVFAAASNPGRAHKHCDDLAVLLTGRTRLLTDAGRYGYSPGLERRYVVSCDAHSTLTYGTTQDTTSDFMLGNGSASLDGAWSPEGEGLLIATGRRSLAGGHEHRRTIAWVPERGLLVLDRVGPNPPGAGTARLRFQLATGVKATIAYDDSTRVDLEADHQVLTFRSHTPGTTWSIERGAAKPLGGWVSPARDALLPAPALVLTTSASSGSTFLTEVRLGTDGVGVWTPTAGDTIRVSLPGRRGWWSFTQASAAPPIVRGPSISP